MMNVEIPGRGKFQFTHLFLDLNGTIAIDGIISEEVKHLLQQLAASLEIVLITADTNGSAKQQCADLPISVHVIEALDQQRQKAEILRSTAGQAKVAVGNGDLDTEMLKAADLSICVMGKEGCSFRAMVASDLLVHEPVSALELLLYQNRLISTWRT